MFHFQTRRNFPVKKKTVFSLAYLDCLVSLAGNVAFPAAMLVSAHTRDKASCTAAFLILILPGIWGISLNLAVSIIR